MNFLAHSSCEISNGCISCENFSCVIQLLGVLFFLVAMAYVYRRLKVSSPHFNKSGKNDRKLEILETKPLGNRQFLLVVAYENEKILMGVHPNGMRFLSKLSPKGTTDKQYNTLRQHR